MHRACRSAWNHLRTLSRCTNLSSAATSEGLYLAGGSRATRSPGNLQSKE
jgi:hypothetical protein